jgi:hypothetical protein
MGGERNENQSEAICCTTIKHVYVKKGQLLIKSFNYL